MKNYITILLISGIVGCTQGRAGSGSEVGVKTPKDVSYMIKKSNLLHALAKKVMEKSDSFTVRKVDKQVKVVTVLKDRVVELKTTNDVLKVQINNLDDTGKPYDLLPVSYDKDHR